MSNELLYRILHLERQVRLLLGLLLAVTALALLGAASPFPPVDEALRASRFELVDEEGRLRGELALRDGDPVLSLFDREGQARLTLNHDAGGTALLIRDQAGVVRLGAAQFSHGGGDFALHRAESKGAAVLYYDDSGSLTFYDHDGDSTLRLPEEVD